MLFSLPTRSRDMIAGSKRRKVKTAAEATRWSLERKQEVDGDNLL